MVRKTADKPEVVTIGFNALTLHLSPNGQALTDGSNVEVRTAGLIAMPQGFIIEGWLDDNTVIGRSQLGAGPDRGNLSWISVNDPSNIHDLGFKADFGLDRAEP